MRTWAVSAVSAKVDRAPSLPEEGIWPGVEENPLPSWRASKSGDLVAFNQACCRLLGFSRSNGNFEELWLPRLSKEQGAQFQEEWRRLKQGLNDRFSMELRWRCRGSDSSPESELPLVVHAQRVQAQEETQLLGWLRLSTSERALDRLKALVRAGT